MELEKQIEAMLFYKAEPITIKKLSKLLNVKDDDVESALLLLEERLRDRGVQLMRKEDSVTLGTSPEMSDLILSMRKEELSRDIGKAGLETLSIILYKGPVARSEIDYIRGVNSSFIVRNLLIRGLVERVTNPNDSRSYLYKPTFELLSFLGVNKLEELPKYDIVQAELQSFLDEETQQTDKEDEQFAEDMTQT